MPRKSVVSELNGEEGAVLASPSVRRSSRIATNSPAPSNITTRRASAQELNASKPAIIRSKRLSFSQENSAVNVATEKKASGKKVIKEEDEEVVEEKTSTSRVRKASTSSEAKPSTKRQSLSEKNTVEKPKPATRTRRKSSASEAQEELKENEQPETKRPVTRARNASISTATTSTPEPGKVTRARRNSAVENAAATSELPKQTRARRTSANSENAVATPEPRKTRARRNSAVSTESAEQTAEAVKKTTRRNSATSSEIVEQTPEVVKKTTRRRNSAASSDAVPQTPEAKKVATRGRRSSVTEENDAIVSAPAQQESPHEATPVKKKKPDTKTDLDLSIIAETSVNDEESLNESNSDKQKKRKSSEGTTSPRKSPRLSLKTKSPSPSKNNNQEPPSNISLGSDGSFSFHLNVSIPSTVEGGNSSQASIEGKKTRLANKLNSSQTLNSDDNEEVCFDLDESKREQPENENLNTSNEISFKQRTSNNEHVNISKILQEVEGTSSESEHVLFKADADFSSPKQTKEIVEEKKASPEKKTVVKTLRLTFEKVSKKLRNKQQQSEDEEEEEQLDEEVQESAAKVDETQTTTSRSPEKTKKPEGLQEQHKLEEEKIANSPVKTETIANRSLNNLQEAVGHTIENSSSSPEPGKTRKSLGESSNKSRKSTGDETINKSPKQVVEETGGLSGDEKTMVNKPRTSNRLRTTRKSLNSSDESDNETATIVNKPRTSVNGKISRKSVNASEENLVLGTDDSVSDKTTIKTGTSTSKTTKKSFNASEEDLELDESVEIKVKTDSLIHKPTGDKIARKSVAASEENLEQETDESVSDKVIIDVSKPGTSRSGEVSRKSVNASEETDRSENDKATIGVPLVIKSRTSSGGKVTRKSLNASKETDETDDDKATIDVPLVSKSRTSSGGTVTRKSLNASEEHLELESDDESVNDDKASISSPLVSKPGTPASGKVTRKSLNASKEALASEIANSENSKSAMDGTSSTTRKSTSGVDERARKSLNSVEDMEVDDVFTPNEDSMDEVEPAVEEKIKIVEEAKISPSRKSTNLSLEQSPIKESGKSLDKNKSNHSHNTSGIEEQIELNGANKSRKSVSLDVVEKSKSNVEEADSSEEELFEENLIISSSSKPRKSSEIVKTTRRSSSEDESLKEEPKQITNSPPSDTTEVLVLEEESLPDTHENPPVITQQTTSKKSRRSTGNCEKTRKPKGEPSRKSWPGKVMTICSDAKKLVTDGPGSKKSVKEKIIHDLCSFMPTMDTKKITVAYSETPSMVEAASGKSAEETRKSSDFRVEKLDSPEALNKRTELPEVSGDDQECNTKDTKERRRSSKGARKSVDDFQSKSRRSELRNSLVEDFEITSDVEEKINALVAKATTADSDSDGESSEDERYGHPFFDDMCEEGEEDTPSEGSNDIIEVGESINTTESDMDSDDSYEADSFVCDDEEPELLSGEEFDLSIENDTNEPKRKCRIINVEHHDDGGIIKIERKVKEEAPKQRSRIIAVSDSSDENDEEEKEVEETVTEVIDLKGEDKSEPPLNVSSQLQELKGSLGANQTSTPTLNNVLNSSKKDSTGRKSITIQENIRVEEIKDAALSERISKVVDLFCAGIKQPKGEVSLNVSLDYAQKSSPERISILGCEQLFITDTGLHSAKSMCENSQTIAEQAVPSSTRKRSMDDEVTSISDVHNKKRKSGASDDASKETVVSEKKAKKNRRKRRNKQKQSEESLHDEAPVSTKEEKEKLNAIRKSKRQPKPSTAGSNLSVMEEIIQERKVLLKDYKTSNDLQSSWVTDFIDLKPSRRPKTLMKKRVTKEKPSVSNRSLQSNGEKDEEKFHKKDFKLQMIYDNSRNVRVDTKQLLKKRGAANY